MRGLARNAALVRGPCAIPPLRKMRRDFCSDPPESLPSAIGNRARPRDHGAAAESPQVFGEIATVLVASEDRVENVYDSMPEFQALVGAADRDCHAPTDALHQNRVGVRHVILENRRAESGADARGLHQIFVRDGQAVQRSQRIAFCLRFIRLCALLSIA